MYNVLPPQNPPQPEQRCMLFDHVAKAQCACQGAACFTPTNQGDPLVSLKAQSQQGLAHNHESLSGHASDLKTLPRNANFSLKFSPTPPPQMGSPPRAQYKTVYLTPY